ncbi:MAG: hypothetical protein JEY79_05585 [Pseudodesulfovibrio sp.]|nr:hypothetical protein [Pseudodesulfovibrio sp.]
MGVVAVTFRWPPDVLWGLSSEDLTYWFEVAKKHNSEEAL